MVQFEAVVFDAITGEFILADRLFYIIFGVELTPEVCYADLLRVPPFGLTDEAGTSYFPYLFILLIFRSFFSCNLKRWFTCFFILFYQKLVMNSKIKTFLSFINAFKFNIFTTKLMKKKLTAKFESKIQLMKNL